jgi:hypothetical protein
MFRLPLLLMPSAGECLLKRFFGGVKSALEWCLRGSHIFATALLSLIDRGSDSLSSQTDLIHVSHTAMLQRELRSGKNLVSVNADATAERVHLLNE